MLLSLARGRGVAMVSVRLQVALAKNVLRCSASQSCIISIRMKPVSYTITATAHATSQIKFSGLRLTVEFVKATALAPGTLPDLDYVVLDFELGTLQNIQKWRKECKAKGYQSGVLVGNQRCNPLFPRLRCS